MYLLSDYDYELPPDRIAQCPAERREDARLLILDRRTGETAHHRFHDIAGLLNSGDLLVVNNTRVIPARLLGRKTTGGRVEALLVDFAGGRSWREDDQWHFECQCLVRGAKTPRPGTKFLFGADLTGRVRNGADGVHTIEFISSAPFVQILEKLGRVPLPPYIARNDASECPIDDRTAYQTVYADAAQNGAVAAPTAGLHFTESLLSRLEEKGIDRVSLTLHVSHGTFMPVRVEDIRDHRMHSERFEISEPVSAKINRARAEGRRIVAVGTTSVRTLEFNADDDGQIRAGSGSCDLFIYPGYRFKAVDAMITNFHLPKSTLLMLVSAFAGRDLVLAGYREAIENDYRFYSYGDAMFIR